MELADWLDIILQYLKVLAWPLVVFVLALVYRRPVITLLQRLKKYSGWGQTVELGDRARDLSEESLEVLTEATPLEPVSPADPVDPVDPEGEERSQAGAEADSTSQRPDAGRFVSHRGRLNESQRILTSYLGSLDHEHFPRAARRMIDDAWFDMKRMADRIASEVELQPWEAANLTVFAHSLAQRGLINPGASHIAQGLDELRRGIDRADDNELTVYVVRDFVDTAVNFTEALQQTLNAVRLDRLMNEPDPDEGQDDPEQGTRA